MDIPYYDTGAMLTELCEKFTGDCKDRNWIIVGCWLHNDVCYYGTDIIRTELRQFYLQELPKLYKEGQLHGVVLLYKHGLGPMVGVLKQVPQKILLSDLCTITPLQHQTINRIYNEGMKEKLELHNTILFVYFNGRFTIKGTNLVLRDIGDGNRLEQFCSWAYEDDGGPQTTLYCQKDG